MDAVSFQAKMFHWRSVGFGRALMKLFGEHSSLREHMTPARYDLLAAIDHHGTSGAPQPSLHPHLGVCREVVRRMIDRLVELGWLTRERAVSDRRVNVVALTALGEELLVRAMAILESERLKTYRAHFKRVFATPAAHLLCFTTLQTLARSLGSRSTYFTDLEPPPTRQRRNRIMIPNSEVTHRSMVTSEGLC
jgi:DNA-binding MarR family transcriptional regulator